MGLPFSPAKPQSSGLASDPCTAMAVAPCSISVATRGRVGWSRAGGWQPRAPPGLQQLLVEESEDMI